MCGGGDGFLGLGKAKQVDPPDPVIPAPPAPERKQDTGAIVAIGDSDEEVAAQRRKMGKVTKGGSAIRNGYASDLGL